MGIDATVFVHPQALVESDEIGANTRVWAFAHILAGAVVGKDCNICDCVFIESGARVGDGVTIKNGVSVWDRVHLGDFVFVGPNAVFTNDLMPRIEHRTPAEEFLPTEVERGATIGANATIVCGNRIGSYAFVGAGAVVTGPVAAHSLVVGNPASAIGWVCECARRLPESHVCQCGRRYRLHGSELEIAR